MATHTWYGCLYVYFDPRPKTKREDLFDREEELKQFSSALGYASLMVVTGLRRTGKTSFVNVALAECGCPHAILDLRGLPYNPSHADFVRRLEVAFKRIDKRWFSGLVEVLKHLRGVSILGNELSFEWSKTGVDIADLFAEVNSWAAKENRKFVIAFDEIQVIRGDKWMLSFLAHVFDSYHNVVIVVTGSEVGVLFDFLGFDQADSPLYGRHYVQVQMKHFSSDTTADFLVEGLKQIKLKYSSEVLEYAIKKLDGVPGWLTLFGVRCRDKNKVSKALVDEVASEAGKLAREEAVKIVLLSRRYAVILNLLAKAGEASWSEIKSVIETKEARSVTNYAVSSLLKNLVNMGIVLENENKYIISDSLLTEGIRETPLPE